jgi:hypothetical protein
MEDHRNAAKASLLLFDADMRIMNNGKTDNLTYDQQEMGRLLASAYNCGSGRTRGAYGKYGEKWNENIPAETQIYLKKFDAVWEWLRAKPQTVQSITVISREIL